jgi:hypothetical protein
MCFYQNTLDINSDRGGTHKINHIYMEVRISNRIGWGFRERRITMHMVAT